MFGIVKLLLLAGLVVLGFVFVPNEFMARIERGVDSAGVYLSGEVGARAPAVKQDISQQVRETKSDAQNLYQSFEQNYWPAIVNWFAGLFGSGNK